MMLSLRVRIAVAITTLTIAPACAQWMPVRTTTWRPNGPVFAVAIDSVHNIAYLGGDFTQLADPVPPFNTVARQRLAAIDLSTGDPTAWNPGADGQVLALAVHGDDVFVGGQQVQCGGASRANLSVIGRTTGLATAWNPQVQGGYVRAFAVSNGTLYFSGIFSAAGGQSRSGAAAFTLATQGLTDWAPVPDDLIRAMVVHNGTVYLGGAFNTMNGTPSERVAAVDTQFGQGFGWSHSVSGGVGVFAMARVGSTLYLGGQFSSVDGTSRTNAAAINSGGSVTAWDPGVSWTVYGLCAMWSSVGLSGSIGSYGAVNMVDATSGALLAWAGVQDEVFALATSSTAVVAGGSFNAVYNYPVTNFAVLSPPMPSVVISGSVHLHGAFDTVTGLMRDNLRSAGILPYTEPYTALGYSFTTGGGEGVIPSLVMNTTGSSAIVDWVVVELRNGTNSAQVLCSRRALVRRSGVLVDLNGQQALRLPAPPGSYFVAIRHRNHLGAMSASPIALSSTQVTNVPFTFSSFLTYGTEARKQVGNTMYLWPGDVTHDHHVKYVGTNNDRDRILTAIGGIVPTATVTGQYRLEDANLDGTVKYSGGGNDRDLVLQTIGGIVPTNVRSEQLP
ncbi:MAG: hypothetical protein JNL43_12795 [Flavobacteriales bacterium]|nr:hypothetical protein [Flavobacteriales bacterium]